MSDTITEEDVIRDASPTAMLEDITGYLANIGVELPALEVNNIKIKCDYWFRIAQLNGVVKLGNHLGWEDEYTPGIIRTYGIKKNE